MSGLSKKQILFWGSLLSILLLFEFVSWLRRPIKPLIRTSLRVEYGLSTAISAVSHWAEIAILGQDTYSRLSELKERLAASSLDKYHLSALQEENNNLSRLLNFDADRPVAKIVTRVIGKDPGSPNQLRLAAGSAQGVRIGSAVVNPDGILVGLIVDADNEISIVRLLNHRLMQVPVRVLNKNRAFGLLESDGGLSLRVTQIPKDADVRPSDVVVTSFVSGEVPPDLPIGTVLSVKNDPQGLWQEGTIAPLMEIMTLNIVAVVVSL